MSNLWIIVSSFVTLPSSQNQPLSAFVKGCQFDITCPHFDITCPLTAAPDFQVPLHQGRYLLRH
ncbi:MAG: hypothetical protein ACLRK4_18530, partial [Ruthenibacterium lactatiformans]